MKTLKDIAEITCESIHIRSPKLKTDKTLKPNQNV